MFDKTGNLYVGNSRGQNISKYASDGTGSVFVRMPGWQPYDVDVDSAGNLFATCNNPQTGDWIIEKFTSGGVASVFATLSGYPCGLEFDSSDNLYVANYHDKCIMKYTPDGVGSVFVSTGIYKPYNLVILPIPEPSTCALLGFAAWTILATRRRKA